MDSYVESRSAGYRVRCVGMVVMSLVYELVIGKHGHRVDGFHWCHFFHCVFGCQENQYLFHVIIFITVNGYFLRWKLNLSVSLQKMRKIFVKILKKISPNK
jgi:hypothetical protein